MELSTKEDQVGQNCCNDHCSKSNQSSRVRVQNIKIFCFHKDPLMATANDKDRIAANKSVVNIRNFL